MKVLDVFEKCRERVSARQAAEFYGLGIDRAGRARCCFHSPDRHPSMTFKGNGFRCWSCGAHGSSIDLVSQLYGLDALGAVRKLDMDFSLYLPLDRQQTPQERTEAARAAAKRRELSDTYRLFEQWRENLVRQLNECFRLAHLTMKDIASPADLNCLNDPQVLAIQWQPVFEHWADTLTSGEMSEIMVIFRERGAIQSRIDQILNHSPMKSGAA